MRTTLITILMATGLFASPAMSVRADASADTLKIDARQAVANDELRGDVARAREDYMAAANWYFAALHLDKRNPVLYNKLGIAELKLGDMSMARRQFAEAVKRNPDYVDALNNLGAVYCLQRKYKSAVHYLKEALALDETKAATHLNLAEAWMGQGQGERAMTEYARALELDADILKSSSSEGVFAQIATPEQRARVSYLIAKAYMKRGNVEGALDYLRRAKEEHYRDLASVYKDAEFAPLWQDPRLATIIRR